MTGPVRFGLVGTGYWARETHAPGIAAAAGVSLAAVWGRDPEAVRGLADSHGAEAHTDFEEFLGRVDAVSFSVPPDVQAQLAVRAAAQGKHLLLEKPIALDQDSGEALAQAVADTGVAALVFFTHLFSPPVVSWFDAIEGGGWLGGEAYWLGSALMDDNPFNTPWRRRYGGLWDVGPHAVVDLRRVLGPVVSVDAHAGARDVTHLVLHHQSGASSTCTLTLTAPDAADGFSMMTWGPLGRSNLPVEEVDSLVALTVAAETLEIMIATGERHHPADLATGLEVLRVLTSAQRQLEAEGRS